MRSSKSRSRNKSNRQRTLGNVINRVFDSSGPEGKVRGTPQQIIDKYLTLARDAQLSNDRVAEQSFFQHAEHYTRMLGEAQREMAERQQQNQQFNRPNGDDGREFSDRDNGGRDSQPREQNNRENGEREQGGYEQSERSSDYVTVDATRDADTHSNPEPGAQGEPQNSAGQRFEKSRNTRSRMRTRREDEAGNDYREAAVSNEPAPQEHTVSSEAGLPDPMPGDIDRDSGLVSTPEAESVPVKRKAKAPRSPAPRSSAPRGRRKASDETSDSGALTDENTAANEPSDP